MKSDDVSTQNRRGRPATGTNPAIGVRLPPDLLVALDRWRRKQSDPPGRPEAIRRLIEAGLNADAKLSPASSAGGAPAEKPTGTGKTAAPRTRKPRSERETQPAPRLSKEAQVRALREQQAG
jgi:hypothetical protein